MKRIISLFLTVFFVLNCISVSITALAEDTNYALAANGTTIVSNKDRTSDVANIIDGDKTSYGWARKDTDTNDNFLTLTFENFIQPTGINIYVNNAGSGQFAVQGSLDGTEWFDLNADSVGGTYKQDVIFTYSTTSPFVKHIKVDYTSKSANTNIYEIEVYGSHTDASLENVSFSPDKGELSPSFDKSINDYVLYIDSMEELPTLNATATDESCEIDIKQASAENNYRASVVVTSTKVSGFSSTYTFQYKLVVPDSTLNSLTPSSGSLKPAFNKDVTNYTLEINSFDSLPEISATASLSSSNVEITEASEENGYCATVVVTSKQNTTTVYTVQYNIPEYYTSLGLEYKIESNDADGSNMTIGEWNLLNDGSGEGAYKQNNPTTVRPSAVLDLGGFYLVSDMVLYHTTAAYGIEVPKYQYSVDGKNWQDFSGTTENKSNTQTTYHIKAKALEHFTADGEKLARYIRVIISPLSNGLLNPGELCVYGRTANLDLKSLSVGDADIRPEFDALVTEYEVVVTSLSDTLPQVEAELPENSANSINIVQASAENDYCATVTVTTPDNHILTYSFRYKEYSSESADLKTLLISVDGAEPVEIEGFDKNTTKYIYYLEDINSIPVISAETDNPAATITDLKQATKKYTVATLTVTAENGINEKTYTVIFASNIALNSPAWAPNAYSGSTPNYGVDGNINTLYWSSTEVTGNGYFNLDLESISDIYAMTLYTTQGSNTSLFAKLSISEDGKNWTPLENVELEFVSSFAIEGSSSACNKMEFSFGELPIKTQYIQVAGATTSKAKMRINELEVYGVSAPIVSSNCFVKGIELSSGEIKGFSKYINSYTVELSANDPIPTIVTAEAEDSAATVTIEQATESNPVATINIVAENGTSKMTYTISFEKQLAPEKNANLSSLSFSRGTLLPEFTSVNTNYTLYLASGESISAEDITAIPAVNGAPVNITEGNPLTVKVTSSDNSETKTYTVNVEYATADLADLIVTGYEITPSFSPSVTEYSVELPIGESIPVLGVEFSGKLINPVASPKTTISVVQASGKSTSAVITVTNDNGLLTKKYTINFKYAQSLSEAQEAVQNAIKDFAVSNDTTADEIMNLAKNSITNDAIVVSWSTPFSVDKSTLTQTGLVSGAITLRYGDDSVVVTIRKAIDKLTGSTGSVVSSGGGGGGGSVSRPPKEETPVVTDPYAEVRGHWAEDYVVYLAEKGIVQGNGTSFALEDDVTRAEFITMLVRAGGFETAAYKAAFSDVSASDWYAPYIQTALDNGFVEGYDGMVNPLNTTTREEAVKMLVGVYESLYGEMTADKELVFTDKELISQWAQEYIEKAVSGNLVTGYDTGAFGAKDVLTRAQAMTMIYRIIKK